MTDFKAWKKGVIRYWEKRRVAFNLILLGPTFLGYVLPASVSAGVGDQPHLTSAFVLFLLFLCAAGANVWFSLVYALEFFLGSMDEKSQWMKWGRDFVFMAGMLVSILTAFACARNIAIIEYSPTVRVF
jgi:hypothetical protein